MEQYLKLHYDEEITNLLNNSDDLIHVSVNINLAHLQRKQPALYAALLSNARAEQAKWNTCLLNAQKALIEGNMFLEPGFQIKQNCHIRFVNMPQTVAEAVKKVVFPNNDNVGQFLQIKGSVIRMTQARFLEFKREYVCNRCKNEIILEAQYEKSYVFDPPRTCPHASETGCKGIPHQKSAQPMPDYCRDFQEIRLQEIMSDRNVPASLIITLENDLVDSCQPGDCITVVGTIERRWGPMIPGKRTEVTVTMSANSVSKDENKMNLGKDLPEHLVFVRGEWQNTIKEIGESAARDLLVQSICPEIHGMYPVKLAVALSLASCTERYLGSGVSIRGHSHLLMVGDPGLAKSRLLKYASEISSRSVFTTGMGCSAAGLTAAAVKEDGEWQLEAGALVLADGGICCIDEFNLMREQDKASIHEAMEQQTISMAKAGLVCKLSTRCVVMAATNPKNLFSMAEMEASNSANLGIGGPLLSRFDLVLILSDERDQDWDIRVANHILALSVVDEIRQEFEEAPPGGHWDLERLQTHFMAIKDIHPKISEHANVILASYYKMCRADPARDPARTTVRLLDSLVRLSQAHARLVFRDEVTPVDAITVIRLMESSWGFGKVVRPVDLIRVQLPLGPDQSEIAEILHQLQLDAVVKGLQVEHVDRDKVDRYQKELAKNRKEATSVNKWDSLSTQQMTKFDEKVLSELDNNKRTSQEVSEECDSAGKSKPIEEGELYSKYSFTQMRKNNTKKIRKEPPQKTDSPEETRIPQPRKRKPNIVMPEPNPKLKENLEDDQLDCILSSLRQNFESELSKATQPAKPNDNADGMAPQTQSSQLNLSFPAASGRSKASREESFRTMLDISCLLDDDDDNEVTNGEPVVLKPTDSSLSMFDNSAMFKTQDKESRFSKDHALLQNPITDPVRIDPPNNPTQSSSIVEEEEVSRFQFKRPRKKTVSEGKPKLVNTNSIPSRVEGARVSSGSSAVTEAEDEMESRYQIRRPTQRSQPKRPLPTDVNPMLVSQPSEESIRGATSSKQTKLSAQTLTRIRGFEFVPKEVTEPANPDKSIKQPRDDSAYESQCTGNDANLSSKPVSTVRALPSFGERDLDAELALLDELDF